jgi:NADH:ubiquinone oxidoreductase subunit F (NADH-binding)
MFWALFVASIRMFVRNRAAVFFSLFLPLIIMLIFGVLNFEGTTTIQLGIADEARNQASAKLIDGLAGGMRGGRAMKFFVPGGASSPWLLPQHLDSPLDMDYVQGELKSMLGSGAIMVFDESTDPLLVAWRLAKFFAHESCGKCTPCREGSGWIAKVLYRMAHGQGRPEDLDLLLSFGNNIVPGLNAPFAQTTICALGPSTMSPVVSLDRWFRDEITDRMRADTERRRTLEVAPA